MRAYWVPLAIRRASSRSFGLEDGQDRAEDLLLGDAGLGRDVGDDHRADEVSLVGDRAGSPWKTTRPSVAAIRW